MHVEAFDTWEQAMEADNQRQLDLLPLIEPWQKELSWGDTFCVYEPSEDLWVFCRVTPEDEMWPPGEIAESPGDSPRIKTEKKRLVVERQEEKQMVAATWERGFRPCQNFSIYAPDGELSHCHVLKALLKLEPEEFEAMRGINWNLKGLLRGDGSLAPETESLTKAVILKLIKRVITPGAVKHA